MQVGLIDNDGANRGGDAWQILVVDDDPDCLETYSELIERLGYACVTASDATFALKVIAESPAIGLVVSDIKMPGMDGLTLLDEVSERFMSQRPIVAIIITGDPSIDMAVSAVRSMAIDFLEKPISLASLSSALRRAKSRWASVAAQFHLNQAGARSSPLAAGKEHDRRGKPTAEDLQALAALIMKTRQNRSKFFDPQIMSGPAWDILIDLTAAGLKGEAVPISSACASTEVPISTALRHVKQLVAAGLIKKVSDQTDRRRTLLELEPQTLQQMTRYLASSWESMAGRSS